MKRDAAAKHAEYKLTEKAWTVKVMVIYEDLQTGLRGRSACVDLQNLWHQKPIFSDSIWHFNFLRDSLFREQAVVDACDADLIILSVHGRTALPPEIIDWLKRWTDEKENRQYIIYLLQDQSRESGGGPDLIVGYLAHITKAAEADLCTSFNNLKFLGERWHDDASLSATSSGRHPDAVTGKIKPGTEARTRT